MVRASLAGLFPEISSCPSSDKDSQQREDLKLNYDGEQRKTTNALLRTLCLSLPNAGSSQRCIQCRSGVETGERKNGHARNAGEHSVDDGLGKGQENQERKARK